MTDRGTPPNFNDKNDFGSIGGIFSSLPFQFLVSPVTIISVGILLQELSSSFKSVFRNTFILLGALTMLFHTITWLMIIVIGIRGLGGDEEFSNEISNRSKHTATWGLMILSSIFTIAFGVFALTGGFGPMFLGNPNEVMTTGYSMMFIVMLHAAFIIYEGIVSGLRKPKSSDLNVFGNSGGGFGLGGGGVNASQIFSAQPTAPVSTIVGNVDIPDISQFLTEQPPPAAVTSSVAPVYPSAGAPGASMGYPPMSPYMMWGYPQMMPACAPQPVTTAPQMVAV